VIAGAATAAHAVKPTQYRVTAVLRVTEGSARAPAAFAQGALHAHVKDLTFTRSRLLKLMKRLPREFPAAANDPDAAFEEMRELIDVAVDESDVIGENSDLDPPRSARISISFTASRPDVAWQVTHELVDLLIDSALARQRAALLRDQAGAESAVQRAEAHAGDTATLGLEAVHARLHTVDSRAASARLAARAAEQGQALRFELVDPGRVPAAAGKGSLLLIFAVVFVIALIGAGVLAGAFDPRVIGATDLQALRIPLLGELPRLPTVPPPSPPA
jgi:hypothetical protein